MSDFGDTGKLWAYLGDKFLNCIVSFASSIVFSNFYDIHLWFTSIWTCYYSSFRNVDVHV